MLVIGSNITICQSERVRSRISEETLAGFEGLEKQASFLSTVVVEGQKNPKEKSLYLE
jgi:hypothetical protein